MVVLIDNYDSFSYNLYQLIGSCMENSGAGDAEKEIRVVRNDKITIPELERISPSHIFLSPGPGKPSEAGICEEVIRAFTGRIPILGVCLGHQAICECFGAVVGYAKQMMHGKVSLVKRADQSRLFEGLPETFKVARYHSLAADDATLPAELIVTARSEDGEIMAVEHRDHPVFGLQFHPESIMTPDGAHMMNNFLRISAI